MIRIKILKPFGPYIKGQVITTDEGDRYWRRRLDDAKIDGSCKVLKSNSKKTGSSSGDEK